MPLPTTPPYDGTFQYTVGERVRFKISVDGTDVDLVTDDVTVNIDYERGDTRFTFRWRPAGVSDDVFELETGELFFTLTSAWTGENLKVGKWVMSISVYDPETEQDEIGAIALKMIQRPGGPLPTTGITP